MSRISPLPLEEWDPELRELMKPEKASPMTKQGLSIMARSPGMAKAMRAFQAEAAKGRTLSQRLAELVRLRVAFHNQCRSCMAVRYQPALDDGLTDDLVCSLEKPEEAPDLTEREKAALAYADLFATDHLAIDDEMFENLRKHFTEDEIVELSLTIAGFVAFGRFGAVMDMVEVLPEVFQDKSHRIKPWETQEEAVVQ